jgi:hypothetical protein
MLNIKFRARVGPTYRHLNYPNLDNLYLITGLKQMHEIIALYYLETLLYNFQQNSGNIYTHSKV